MCRNRFYETNFENNVLHILTPTMPRNTPLPMIAGIAVLVVGYLLTDWSTTQSSLFATVHTLLWALYTRYELLCLRNTLLAVPAPAPRDTSSCRALPHTHYHARGSARACLTLAAVVIVGANPLRSLTLSLLLPFADNR